MCAVARARQNASTRRVALLVATAQRACMNATCLRRAWLIITARVLRETRARTVLLATRSRPPEPRRASPNPRARSAQALVPVPAPAACLPLRPTSKSFLVSLNPCFHHCPLSSFDQTSFSRDPRFGLCPCLLARHLPFVTSLGGLRYRVLRGWLTVGKRYPTRCQPDYTGLLLPPRSPVPFQGRGVHPLKRTPIIPSHLVPSRHVPFFPSLSTFFYPLPFVPFPLLFAADPLLTPRLQPGPKIS